jgi:hypothetical protein
LLVVCPVSVWCVGVVLVLVLVLAALHSPAA